MKREELIYKWLNHELNADELDNFKKLEDYDVLIKLNNGLLGFKSPNYNTPEALKSVLEHINSEKTIKKSWLPIIASVAAVFILFFGFYYYSTTFDSNFKTLTAQKQTIELPDGSTVRLNSLSELSFNKSNWSENREIKLDGEAYFKVAKGSKFQVKTPVGIVNVLGTQFNVKQREDFFEVICFEGSVNVAYTDYVINLSPGNRVLIRDGQLITTEKEDLTSPSWIKNYSQFKSAPYEEVLAEFERQYDIKIKLKSVDASQLFTGSFTHDNMETALKSITLPLQLTYSKTNRTITLKRE